MSFNLPKLLYSYDALEPYIDKNTMEIHHTKHHASYVEKLNNALEGHESLQEIDIESLLSNVNKMSEEIKTPLINFGGGHANHSLFWSIMGPGTKDEIGGQIEKDINSIFGSTNAFKENFSDSANKIFGCGWAWLVVDKDKLEIVTTQNQISPLSEGKSPILCLDVWEHAYYLKYQNKRNEYIKAWWNVVNWRKVDEVYKKLRK